jgi:hypothetical protein
MRQLFQLLTFLAFAIQVWIPAGFMPDVRSQTMVICSGLEQAAVKVDSSGHPVPESRSSEKCPYATLAASGVVPTTFSFDILPASIQTHHNPPDQNPIATLNILSARPRGPPAVFS